MDDFDFGFRPQGKSAPMKPSSSSSSIGSRSASTRSASPFSFDDVFSAPPKAASPPSFDSIFDGFKDPNPKSSSMSSMPVYDKPVYDDDIFDGVPGIKSSTKVEYEDVFGSISKGGGHVDGSGAYDDLLGGLGSSSKRSEDLGSSKRSEDLGGFEELIPGFGGSSPSTGRDPSETNQQKPAGSSAKSTQKMPEDPFVVLETASTPAYPSSGVFTDPLEDLGRPRNSGSANVDASPMDGGIFDDIDALNGLGKSVPPFTYEKSASQKARSPPNSVPNRTQEKSPFDAFDNAIPKTQSTSSFDSRNSTHSSKWNDSQYERYATADQSPSSSEHLETADDVWLTVSEIPLFTQPTNAPPPPRPAPTLINKPASYGRTDHRRKDNESYSQSDTSYMHPKGSVRRPNASPIDELEDFAMNKPQSSDRTEAFSSEDDIETNSAAAASAAAMKEAMDRAEAKFKHAKEVRGREQDAKSAKSREFVQQERDEATPDTQDVEDKENQENLERERLQREREERERERRRIEKERELERERGRQAVERATREARERAAAEARAKAERAAVDKANAEARQRAERAAVQRAAQEARERAAAEARQKAERAAAEAREKAVRERAATEARDRAAERAAVDRAAAEARVRAERAAVDRAHAEARERAAAAAREKQNKTENDLESFFSMGARANSAPKQRASTTENIFDTQTQSRGSADGTKRSADGTKRTSSTSSSTIKKASSTTNIVDDLTSIFGGAPSSGGEFLEVEGETEERRRARLDRHQRTLERAAKALAEKNERDMQTQRDQAERHRISETLDIEIKRWAAGKEGNLRALLSTLQYVLWPGCGWQPVSLTDLITAAAVKKVYRKATLCIHPDKVQQKGANIQQKYIAEKVFDLLKEAWNKFNSEELF